MAPQKDAGKATTEISKKKSLNIRLNLEMEVREAHVETFEGEDTLAAGGDVDGVAAHAQVAPQVFETYWAETINR